jgi:hypothetical protein
MIKFQTIKLNIPLEVTAIPIILFHSLAFRCILILNFHITKVNLNSFYYALQARI